jgi:hypothetical protein
VGPDGNFWAPFPYGQQLLLKFNVNGSVVSSTPLSYAPDWFPHQGQAAVPLMHTLVSDTSRYVYFTDDSSQIVLRVDGAGNLTMYPTYSTVTNIVDDPMYLVRDASGTLYLASTAVLGFTQAEMQQAFTPLDTSLW